MRNPYAKARAVLASPWQVCMRQQNEMLICIKASVNLQPGGFCAGKKLS
jgi:hypothetical protein